MRLLVDARPLADPKRGGVARVAERLIAAYTVAFPGDELVLATTGMTAPRFPTTYPNIRSIHLKIPNKLWTGLMLAGMTTFTEEMEKRAGKIDATFLPNLGFVGPLQNPTGLLLHDLSFLIEPKWFGRKQRLWHDAVNAKRLIRSADRLFSVSERTKQDAIRLLGIPKNRIEVIPVGPTLEAEASTQASPRRYALALGWNDRRKNAMTAVRAVEALRRDMAYSDLGLVIVGRDVRRPTDTELASLYANAAVFLYPSWYEGYGLPLWEAARFGTPCVASTSGALPETAPPGTFFANPAKPHHWVEALRIALTSERKPMLPDTTWESAARIVRQAMLR